MSLSWPNRIRFSASTGELLRRSRRLQATVLPWPAANIDHDKSGTHPSAQLAATWRWKEHAAIVLAIRPKLLGAIFLYDQLKERRRELDADGQAPRLRGRRPWMLSTYRQRVGASRRPLATSLLATSLLATSLLATSLLATNSAALVIR